MLTKDQKRFFNILEMFPRLVRYWNMEKRELDIERLTNALPAMEFGGTGNSTIF